MSCHPILLKAIKENGLRMTRQRKLVLDALHLFSTPATVQQILHAVRKEDPSFEESTVYRTLVLFNRFHLVASISTESGPGRWHHVRGEDAAPRLVCKVCGGTMVLADDHLESLLQLSARKFGFVIDPAATRIPGICIACQRKVGNKNIF